MIWRSSYHKRIAQIADFLTVMVSFTLAYFISTFLHKIEPGFFPPREEIRTSFLIILFILSVVYEVLFDQQKAYNYQRFTSLLKEYSIVIKVCFFGLLISISLMFLFGFKEISRTILILFFFISLLLSIAEKSILFYGPRPAGPHELDRRTQTTIRRQMLGGRMSEIRGQGSVEITE